MTKAITVQSDIIDALSLDHVVELTTSLETTRIIPHKLAYFSPKGAQLWDDFYKDHLESDDYTTSQTVVSLLESSYHYMTYMTDHKPIHVLDIGPGNAYPMKDTLARFQKDNLLKSYTAFDLSQAINTIALKNINTWSPTLPTTQVVGDFEDTDFSKLLVQDHAVANAIFLIGGSISNFINRQAALENILKHFGKNNFLSITFTLIDAVQHYDHESIGLIDSLGGVLPKQLGIDTELCSEETVFDESTKQYLGRIILDKDYSLHFVKGDFEKTVHLQKGDGIVVWMHVLSTFNEILELIEASGGNVSFAAKSTDETNALFLVKAK